MCVLVRRADNTYFARYGADNWEDAINDCVFMKQYMDIRELVTKIHDKTKVFCVNTTHGSNCFYHDALSQMPCAETV